MLEVCPMRLMNGNSKSNTTYHVIRDIKKNGKRSTEIVENLGIANEIKEKYGVKDALKQYGVSKEHRKSQSK